MYQDNPTPSSENPPTEEQNAPTTEAPASETPATQESKPEQKPEAGQPAPKKAQPKATPIKTTQEERMWAAIGYVAFLGVVTLAMKSKSEFCRKHASHGLTLFAMWFVAVILMVVPIVAVYSTGMLLVLAITAVAIFGIVKAITSYELKLPVLSDIAKHVPIDTIIGTMTGKTSVKPVAAPQEGAPAQAEATPEEPKTETEAAPEKEVAAPTEEAKPEEPKAETPTEEKAPEATPAEEPKAEEAKPETPAEPAPEAEKAEEPSSEEPKTQ